MTTTLPGIGTLRLATMDDAPALERLIVDSVTSLSVGFLSREQISGELSHVISLDTTLVADGTYFVVVTPDGTIAGAGGWSRRRTVYGGDAHKRATGAAADDDPVDPRTEPARIRQMFTHPAWARRGIARRILETSLAAAASAGFTRVILTATMPGVPLYQAMGFRLDRELVDRLPNGIEIPVAEMSREIDLAI